LELFEGVWSYPRAVLDLSCGLDRVVLTCVNEHRHLRVQGSLRCGSVERIEGERTQGVQLPLAPGRWQASCNHVEFVCPLADGLVDRPADDTRGFSPHPIASLIEVGLDREIPVAEHSAFNRGSDMAGASSHARDASKITVI
jgi:hypothetical protein